MRYFRFTRLTGLIALNFLLAGLAVPCVAQSVLQRNDPDDLLKINSVTKRPSSRRAGGEIPANNASALFAPTPLEFQRAKQDQETDESTIQEVTLDQVLAMKSSMDIDVNPSLGDVKKPEDQYAQYLAKHGKTATEPHPHRVVDWVAPNIRYQPLYFEDVVLERYGQTYGYFPQPWVSGARFITAGLFLPYNVMVEHPKSCDAPLGYYRPGSCTENQRQRWIYRK